MGGGLLQLVAYGAQDVYLTGNPQITFFKVVYRRHTNFAIEAIQQTFNGTVGYGQTVNCQISRNGDLINRVYLQVELPMITGLSDPTDGPRYVNYVGLRLIKSVLIEIGGQQIDKHYSDWLYIWNELSLPRGKRYGYDTMVGADKDVTSYKNTTLYIPLEFWFCRNVGLALPLIALQYHEVKINLQFETAELCRGSSVTADALTAFPDATLWVDYVFLDTDERRRFAQLSHEYLIEQLQFTGSESVSSTKLNSKLSFNHPCKELIWFANKKAHATDQARTNNNWFNYTTAHDVITNTLPYYYNENQLQNKAIASLNTIASAKLILNGNDRFSGRPGSYFNLIQPFQHHENIPANAGINVYSFALKPEEHQPSGTLNMSRIDTATLSLDFQSGANYPVLTENTTLNVYAINYNVLRILSGMGGLAYSN
jgi:hypothetical protein